MNALARWPLRLLVFVCGCCLCLPASGQRSVDAWDLISVYTCKKPDTDKPALRLFLLPDMSWDFYVPFTHGSARRRWDPWQICNVTDKNLHASKSPRFFVVESSMVRLYNT